MKYVDILILINKLEIVNIEVKDDILWELGLLIMVKIFREYVLFEGSLFFEVFEFGIYKEDINEEKKYGVDCSEIENKKEIMNENINVIVNVEVKYCLYEELLKGS